MRAVVQRVAKASVTVDGKVVSEMASGLLILLGIVDADTREDIQWLARKIVNLRIFNDKEGVMNLSLLDTGGNAIVVSQFTLHASTKKGSRPSYMKAAKPEIAKPLYEAFLHHMEMNLEKEVGAGVFGANMQISLLNDGPVTITMDTQNKE